MRRRRRREENSRGEGQFGEAKERNGVVRSEGMRPLGRDGREEG